MSRSARPTISFVALFYRDAPTVESVLRALDRVLAELCESYEIIAIDDCSPDDTWATIQRVATTLPRVVPVQNPTNLGVGASFQRAARRCAYDWIGYTDGDDQFEVDDLRLLTPHLTEADVVSGRRARRADGFRRVLASEVFNFLARSCFPIPLRDINSALKLYRTALLKALPDWDSGAFYDTEIIVRLAVDHSARMVEVPVRHKPRPFGEAGGLSTRNIRNILQNLSGERMQRYRRPGPVAATTRVALSVALRCLPAAT
ncbi:glycosyltransferase family 2 protein [Actomonas aquatica]|uniref:Glycosyltransferase family 2 protein n=1 Tax=Actomonas aquatica TaxID=2866162 RepID=A0ABZ1CB65_9BACT|nr:glycosyltransferase family 2 protein [Opitutus sp. WL0086]WRQ88932.1 glycosyltransferase family 2 protein [Opitutus sp. WL0086]